MKRFRQIYEKSLTRKRYFEELTQKCINQERAKALLIHHAFALSERCLHTTFTQGGALGLELMAPAGRFSPDTNNLYHTKLFFNGYLTQHERKEKAKKRQDDETDEAKE